jgi:hypothetical protein
VRKDTERVELSSEAIASVRYEPERRTLDIEFTSGTMYRYSGVPPAVYEALISAESHGRYFMAAIRSRYRYVKLRSQGVRS